MVKETYKAARERLLKELAAGGWYTQTIYNGKAMVRPWAQPIRTCDDTAVPRLTFHAQAVYAGAHSLFVDIRGMTCEDLIIAYYRAVG